MSLAGRIVIVQALIGIGCCVAFFAIDSASGRSAFLALLTSWVPTAYYAWVQSRTLNAARLLMHGVLKSVFTFTLMAVCIVVWSVEPLGFFVTFAAMQLGYLTRGGSSGESAAK